MSNQLPDLLPAVKAWIIATGIVGGRCWYRLPLNPKQVPFARISRSGGGPEADSQIPVTRITVLVEFWGMANSDYDVVRGAGLALEQATHAINGPSWAGADTGVVILAANVLTSMDSPDPDTGWPRYLVTLSVTGRAA